MQGNVLWSVRRARAQDRPFTLADLIKCQFQEQTLAEAQLGRRGPEHTEKGLGGTHEGAGGGPRARAG